MPNSEGRSPACSYAPPDPTTPTTVVLVSGGVDSTVLLYQLTERRRPGEFSVYPLFIDYAQRAAEFEYEAATWHCPRLNLQLQRLDISGVGEAFRRARSMKPHIPLPHRNLVALSLALSYVAVVGAKAVALGVIRDDVGGYASASLPFLDAFGELAQTLGNISFQTPFVYWPKAQVIAEGDPGVARCAKSLDQHIADAYPSPLRSLEVGGLYYHKHPLNDHPGYSHDYLNRIAWQSADKYRSPVADPGRLFEQLFASGDQESAARIKFIHARKKSILDHLHKDATRLSGRLPEAYRPVLASYMETVRELELQVTGPTHGCADAPPKPTGELHAVQTSLTTGGQHRNAGYIVSRSRQIRENWLRDFR